jgi:O-succinylbenzoic acid--CoA ligase
VSIVAVGLAPYALPFRAPLATARGILSHRQGWLVALEDDAGRRGWGDAAGWPSLGTDPDTIALALGDLAGDASLAHAPSDSAEAIGCWIGALAKPPEIRFALELALADLAAQRAGVPLHVLLGGERSTAVPSHLLVTDGLPPNVLRAASHLKLKIGGDVDAAEERLARLRATAGSRARLRLDAGGAWCPNAARRAVERLGRYDIEWLEQPFARGELAATAALRAATGVRVALDESVRTPADLEAVLAARAADVVVLKPMFAGGMVACLAMARRARAEGLACIVTSALESAVGRTGAAHLAALLDGVHGVGGALARDVAPAPAFRGDRVELPAGPGLGLAPAADVESAAVWRRIDGRPSARPIRRAASPVPDPSRSIPAPLASAARAAPDHPLIVCGSEVWTARALVAEVARRAAVLAGRGIAPGAVVALDGAPSARWALALHALGWLGAAVAPLPPGTPAAERARRLALLAPACVLDADDPLAESRTPFPERDWPLEETRLVLWSSGTSGTPHPVALSTRQIVFSAFGSALRLGHDPADRWLCCLPLHHVGGISILMRGALYGITVALHERFDAARVSRAIDEEGVTLVSLVPQMLAALLDVRRDRPFPPELRAILVGGAACPPDLCARARRIAAPVALSWGMTETASQIATRRPGDLSGDAGAGPPLAFARVSSSGDRLAVEGPIAGAPFVTSDRGNLDARERVQLLGRADDVIVSGGVNVAPAAIEAVLTERADVAEAAVVGVRSARWGGRPIAALVSAPGAPRPSADTLRAHCRSRLSAPEVPDAFVWLPALPRTELGKLSRSAARALVERALGTEAESLEARHERRRHRDGREAREVDERVHEPRRGANGAARIGELVGEGDRALAEPLDGERDAERLTHAHRPLEVGLAMHERHPEAVLGEHRVDPPERRGEHVLEGLVAVLEHAPEEHDAGAVRLVEARLQLDGERHDHGAR